jgi:nicotinamide-nucleotide amidase
MDFESKITSREISEILWETEKTVGTAESCTGGRIAEAIIAVPAPRSISRVVSSHM